jgi:osmotically-inducible protein OsmY
MRSDTELHDDVLAELRWDQRLREKDIAVAVREGVVTLAGTVESYAQRYASERAVERVKGVRAIVNDLAVKLPGGAERSDADIAHAALDAMRWDIEIPHDRITVKVTDGWVTLEGEVQWYFQKDSAERAVGHLAGVKGVSNLLLVSPTPAPSNIKQRIKETFKRQAELDADHITVEAAEHKVVLKGNVESLAEKRAAERAAWNSPGVTRVDNQLRVGPAPAAVAW